MLCFPFACCFSENNQKLIARLGQKAVSIGRLLNPEVASIQASNLLGGRWGIRGEGLGLRGWVDSGFKVEG